MMKQDYLQEQENAIFSIYCTSDAIELRIGCQDCDTGRFVSAHKSYENADAFCQSLAKKMGLPFKDFAGDRQTQTIKTSFTPLDLEKLEGAPRDRPYRLEAFE